MGDFFEALQQSRLVQAFGMSGFWYGVVTVVHYFTVFTLIGTVTVLDLYLLGLLAKGQKATEFAEQIFPWIWISMILAVLSGFLLASFGAGAYYFARSMRIKVLVVLLAFLCTFFIRRNVEKWDSEPVLPAMAKLMAVLSLVLWVGAILAGNDIAALCGLG